MEGWIPLLNIFLHSQSAEREASVWMQQNPIKAADFLPSLLSQDVLYYESHPQQHQQEELNLHSQPIVHKCMWIETLPHAMQARILSFLTMECLRFNESDLRLLATNILKQPNLDFWVMKSARNLLNTIEHDGFVGTHFTMDDEFSSLPAWLKVETIHDSVILPWLPLSEESIPRIIPQSMKKDFEFRGEEVGQVIDDSVTTDYGVDEPVSLDSKLESSIQSRALALKEQLLRFDDHGDANKASNLAEDIRKLCKLGHSMTILGLIEPCKANEETMLSLLAHLLSENGTDDCELTSHVLCAFLLPRLLVLNEPASRQLMSTTVKYAKLYQNAAAEAIFLPLVLRKDGLNVHICDVLSRIVKDCLHPVHLSLLCQKLLIDQEEFTRMIIWQFCHGKDYISNCLVWTESLFVLFQNILNQNVFLTQDTVDSLVSSLESVAERFSKSLKFGNFMICFVGKCGSLLKFHRSTLLNVAEKTNTFISKSLISKINRL